MTTISSETPKVKKERKKRLISRLYQMSDAELLVIGGTIANLAEHDLAELSVFGITTATIDNLRALRETFMNTPDDIAMLGEQVVSTENLSAMNTAVISRIMLIRTMAASAWGKKSSLCQSFGFGRLAGASPEKIFRLAKRVAAKGTFYLADLTPFGLTSAIISGLTSQNSLLDDALDAQFNAETDREAGTLQRIETGNAFYKEIMRITSCGKAAFISVNHAKYSNYVIEQLMER